MLQVKAFTTKHIKQRKTLEEKKKAKRAALKRKEKKSKALCKCGDVERRKMFAYFKQTVV